MKQLHRADLFGWSVFQETKDIDFNGTVWVRPEGNVVIDPMPLSDHDRAHLESLGGAAWIVMTNSDHIRASLALATWTDARLAAPSAERDMWPFECDRWLADGEELVPGLSALAMEGSKTPGELALVIEHDTLVTGDLVRCHRGGSLTILPDGKLTCRAGALRSVRRLAALEKLVAVIVGDGWHVFSDGGERLTELAQILDSTP